MLLNFFPLQHYKKKNYRQKKRRNFNNFCFWILKLYWQITVQLPFLIRDKSVTHFVRENASLSSLSSWTGTGKPNYFIHYSASLKEDISPQLCRLPREIRHSLSCVWSYFTGQVHEMVVPKVCLWQNPVGVKSQSKNILSEAAFISFRRYWVTRPASVRGEWSGLGCHQAAKPYRCAVIFFTKPYKNKFLTVWLE